MATRILPPKARPFVQTKVVGGNLVSLTMPSGTTARIPIEAEMSSDEIGWVNVADKKIVEVDPSWPRIEGIKIFAKAPGITTIALQRKWGGTPLLLKVIVNSRLALYQNVPLRIRLDNMLLLKNEGKNVDDIDAEAVMEFNPDFEPQSVVKQLASTKSYWNVYFSCHSLRETGIKLGRGITNGKDFAPLAGKVTTMWLCTCGVLAHPWGRQLVKEIVTSVGCNVIAASTAVQVTPNVGRNVIETTPAYSYVAYRPDGSGGVTPYSEDAFYRFGPQLGFEVIKLGDSLMP